MQMVGPIIDCPIVLDAVNLIFSIGNAVSISPDYRAKVWIAAQVLFTQIIFQSFKATYNIAGFSTLVRCFNGSDNGAIIGHFNHNTVVITQGKQISLSSVGQVAKCFTGYLHFCQI